VYFVPRFSIFWCVEQVTMIKDIFSCLKKRISICHSSVLNYPCQAIPVKYRLITSSTCSSFLRSSLQL